MKNRTSGEQWVWMEDEIDRLRAINAEFVEAAEQCGLTDENDRLRAIIKELIEAGDGVDLGCFDVISNFLTAQERKAFQRLRVALTKAKEQK
jgi:hypothetical protein